MGLGPSQVSGFVKRSRAYLEFDSEAGRGTAVALYSPRAAEAPSAVEEPGDARFGRRGQGETILAVEDGPAVRKLVVSLPTDLGHESVEAENGKTALEIPLERPDIALLFSDAVLPGGIGGPEIARAARRRPAGARGDIHLRLQDGRVRRSRGSGRRARSERKA